MNNSSSIHSGTFCDRRHSARQPTPINAPHAFSSATNSSIPLSGASQTSINSSHMPSPPPAGDEQARPLTTQPVRHFFQLYKAAPSMNLASDSQPAADQPDRQALSKGPTAPKWPRSGTTSQQAEKR